MEKISFSNNNESNKKGDVETSKGKAFLKKALVTISALTLPHQTMSPEHKKTELPQEKEIPMPVSSQESKIREATPFHERKDSMEDSIPSKADVENEYNKNKEKNDSAFNPVFTLPENDSILVSVEVHGMKDNKPIEIIIKVRHKNSDGSINNKETFTSSEELGVKYAQYQQEIDSTIKSLYSNYQINKGWEDILREKEKTLLQDQKSLDCYEPDIIEMGILKADAEAFKRGEKNDGFDALYLYYGTLTKTHEDMYRFYQKYKATPYTLAKYLRNKYYVEMINK